MSQDNKKATKKQLGGLNFDVGRVGVGSPQNVSHLMVDKSSDVSLTNNLSAPEDKPRMWFRKYKTRGRSRSRDGEDTGPGGLSEKKIVQVQMALISLSHQDPGAREHGLKVLVNLSLEPGSQLMMTDAIPHLVELMKSESSVTQMFATFVLASASLEPINQKKIRDAGGIEVALGFLRSNNSEILEKALWLLTNVTREGVSRRVVVEAGGVPMLVGLLGSSQMAVVVHTTQVLRNLFYEIETQILFAESGGIDLLIRLYANQKLSGVVSVGELRLEWTNLVCILAYYSPEIRTKLVRSGAIDILCVLLSADDQQVVSNATQALTNLATEKDHVQMIADTAGPTSLVQQLISSNRNLQEQTALLLINLGLVNNQVVEAFHQYGGIEAIFNLLQELTIADPLLWKIIYLVATLSRDELCRRELLEMGTMPLIEKASKFKDENMKMACCMALYNLKLSFVHLKAHKEQKMKKAEEQTKTLVEGDDEKGVMHRARVVNEIVNTEKQYVENLLVIVKVYKEPLTKNSKLLSRDERVKIFSIVDTLYTVHSNFLQKLQKVILDQTPSGIIALGEVFKDELVQELKVYRLYINNYDESCDTLVEAMNKPAFASWLEERTSAFKSKALPSLLITPIQRIPRYCLLLTELLKNMPKAHPDYEPLTATLNNIQDIANYLEEEKSKAFSQNEMFQMQAKITDLNCDFTEVGSRRFIRQGTLLLDSTTDQEFMSKSNLSAKVQYIHLWLMTDKLVMSRAEKKSQKHKLIAVFEVNKLKITKLTVEADGIKRVVIKLFTDRGAFVVYAVEEDVLEDWQMDISDAIEGKEKKEC